MIPLINSFLGPNKTYQDCIDENRKSRFKHTSEILNAEALGRSIPSFYVSDRDLERMRNANSFVAGWSINLGTHFTRHISKSDSDFHVIFIYSRSDLLRHHLLPFRSNRKPYLCFFHINLDQRMLLAYLPFFMRKDVIFFSFDLGDHILKSDGECVLSGVTIPSVYEYEGDQRKISAVNRYLISFKGNCEQHGWFDSCFVRKRLKQLALEDRSGKYQYLYLDTSDEGIDKSKDDYMRILKESTFCFVLHGDGRWSHRFVEVLGSGGIPVIISDNLTLPFEQIVNYDRFCIKIPEQTVSQANSINDVFDLLPNGRSEIVSMMERIKVVYDTCFRDGSTRVSMLLLSAKHHHLSLSA